ncbi:hypothetical protein I302_103610 [Kwoniella bestiolae CBS 10118]|uniref:Uncharacterized protein n=1 Tax=Kwoniella bestiolae CBS 10118 TaxID=1296100 RepID=A0A1B9G909_9TREE|nr:hypothetical protein I302_02313 [Kwoniella bestiolae CBS 10118]OCF27471.1 hypothetical protein I302_02313 [Kwoniella bestiolae CBS 10118]
MSTSEASVSTEPTAYWMYQFGSRELLEALKKNGTHSRKVWEGEPGYCQSSKCPETNHKLLAGKMRTQVSTSSTRSGARCFILLHTDPCEGKIFPEEGEEECSRVGPLLRAMRSNRDQWTRVVVDKLRFATNCAAPTCLSQISEGEPAAVYYPKDSYRAISKSIAFHDWSCENDGLSNLPASTKEETERVLLANRDHLRKNVCSYGSTDGLIKDSMDYKGPSGLTCFSCGECFSPKNPMIAVRDSDEYCLPKNYHGVTETHFLPVHADKKCLHTAFDGQQGLTPSLPSATQGSAQSSQSSSVRNTASVMF